MRTLLFGIALACASVAGCSRDKTGSEAKAEEQHFPTMTIDEVEAGIAAKTVVPADCNGDRTRSKLGVVPGAILITDEEQFAASELPADKATKLVFYCSDEG